MSDSWMWTWDNQGTASSTTTDVQFKNCWVQGPTTTGVSAFAQVTNAIWGWHQSSKTNWKPVTSSPPSRLPPPQEFSPHVNASDMVAEFIRQVRSLGVPDKDVLQLPLHLFISWLIIEASEKEGENLPESIIPVERDPLLRLAAKPRCLSCGKFIPRRHYRNRFPYCDPLHAQRHLNSQELQEHVQPQKVHGRHRSHFRNQRLPCSIKG